MTEEARKRLENWDPVKGVEQLRKLSLPQMEELCSDLRALIMETTEKTGGHLGSNLGVIELTVALLRSFDFQTERLIWDVGHQCYAWKILTGRGDRFNTLRTEGGLSGFPKREESSYDSFNTGHASTSLSALIGYSRARRIRGDRGLTVAVIGDGAMTGGMVWEALNNLSPDDNVLIILNDNEMSISPNVGTLSRHLKNIRVSPRYLRLKPKVDEFLQKLPLLGLPLIRLFAAIKKRTRRAIQPPDSIFESLGLRYYGPIDGHSLPDLCRYLKALGQMTGPRLLHISTVKGKGYQPAEDRPTDFHGVSPDFQLREEAAELSPVTASQLTPASTTTDTFGKLLVQLAGEEPKLCAITAAMMSGTGLKRFAETWPKRIYDVGIAEEHAMTFAAGLAAGGVKPVLVLYSTFMQRAYDQLLHDCCLQRLPVVICLDRSGFVGEDGETHQGLYDLSICLPLPNLTLLAPRDAETLEISLRWALKEGHEGPVVLRYPKGKWPAAASAWPSQRVAADGRPLPTVLREGRDLNVIAVGTTAQQAWELADKLVKEGKEARVIDPGCLKPLSLEELRSVLLPGKPLMIIEEGSRRGGFGEWLRGELAWDAPVLVRGVPDEPVEQASVAVQRRRAGLDAESLLEACRRFL